MTSVVNLNRDPYDVYIGRAGKGRDGYFGNPFVLGRAGNRLEVIRRYCEYFTRRIAVDSEFRLRVESLRGRTLGCFCKPKACHGDVIAEYLNHGGLP